jgi:hypothetical protein
MKEKPPLPPMCALCQSIKRIQPIGQDEPSQNQCFVMSRRIEDYAPFQQDKRTIRLFCDNFSHIKTAVFTLRGGGRKTVRATPERPKVELSEPGPLFAKDGDR